MSPRKWHRNPNFLEEFGGDRALTVNVESAEAWNEPIALQDSLNTTAQISRTPSTAYTFGFPGRSSASVQPTPISPTAQFFDLQRRRVQRYQEAESALNLSQAHALSEASEREMKVRILHRAMDVAKTRSEEARTHSVTLQKLLAARDVKPEEIQSLKRERWRDEKLLSSNEFYLESFSQHINQLASSDCEDASNSQLESVPGANLSRFFLLSSTRKPLRGRRKRSTADSLRSLVLAEGHPPSRRSMQVQETDSLLLSASSRIDPKRNSFAMTFGIGRTSIEIPSSRLDDDDGDSMTSSSTCSSPTASLARFSALSPTDTFVTEPMTAGLPAQVPQLIVQKDGLQLDIGRATIYQSAWLSKTRDQIMAELSDVSLPKYAVELMDEFHGLPSGISPRLRVESSPSFVSRNVNANPLIFNSPTRSDTSDWEVLSPSEEVPEHITFAPTGHAPPVEFIDSPPSRRRHRPLLSLDSSMKPNPESIQRQTSFTRRPSLLRKRPPRSNQLFAIPETSPRLFAHPIEQAKKSNLSFSLFSSSSPRKSSSALPAMEEDLHLENGSPSHEQTLLIPEEPRRKRSRKFLHRSGEEDALPPTPTPSPTPSTADAPELTRRRSLTAKVLQRLHLA